MKASVTEEIVEPNFTIPLSRFNNMDYVKFHNLDARAQRKAVDKVFGSKWAFIEIKAVPLRLKAHIWKWKEINASQFVLNIIENGILFPFTSPPPPKRTMVKNAIE